MSGMRTDKFDAQVRALKFGLEQFKNSVQQRIVRRSVGKALTVIRKAIRGKVPSKYKDIKRLVGSRLGKRLGQSLTLGKVGVGVGIKKAQAKKINDKLKEKRAYRRFRKRTSKAGGTIGGVGIGPENVHWWILGTKARSHKSGRSTGAMPPQVPDIVKDGFNSSYQNAMNVMIEESRKLIAIERKKIAEQVARAT